MSPASNDWTGLSSSSPSPVFVILLFASSQSDIAERSVVLRGYILHVHGRDGNFTKSEDTDDRDRDPKSIHFESFYEL